MNKASYPIPAFESKVLPLNFTADQLFNALQVLEKPMVFTNGVFDILHRGHVSYLAQAKSLGASLVVGVNADISVRMLGKGDDRPINTEMDRMALLASLESVDLVVPFSDKTPVSLIAQIKPEIYVKGGDYDIDTLEETALVRTWGGLAYAIPFIHFSSTTKLLEKIRI
jgi:rfaE bifunctional protein nucleotidyltransferase chain/domain